MVVALRENAERGLVTAQKRRGAYFTPEAVASFVTKWAVRHPTDKVLEPSCGEAAFLTQASLRLRSLTQDARYRPIVYGFEIDGDSATVANQVVERAGGTPEIAVSDFFDVAARREFHVVLGNPPFVNFHLHSGDARKKSQAAARRAGIALSGLASSWAAFVVYSTEFLLPGGRLGMVLPSELLSVDYAADVRELLLSRFASVEIVSFSSPVFPGVQTDALVLLAEGFGGSSDQVKMRDGVDPSDLVRLPEAHIWNVSNRRDKWTQGRSSLVWEGEEHPNDFDRLDTWGDPSLGVVTGNNGFFAVTAQEAERLNLSSASLRQLAPPLRPDARGLDYTPADLAIAEARMKPVWLFAPAETLSKSDIDYISSGEVKSVHQGYKCRHRSPWWAVPAGKPGDLMVTYMSAGVPRIVANPSSYLHLNSVHRFYVPLSLRNLAMTYLPSAALNSFTSLSAERLGRSYGGGVLKLELGELRALPVPTPGLVKAVEPKLDRLRDSLDRLLRSGRINDAIHVVDSVILRGELGWTRGAVQDLFEVAVGIRVNRQDRSRP